MKLTPIASALALALSLAACNKPEAPQKTEADVMKAAAAGQKDVTEAATEAVKEHMDNVADAHQDGKALSAGDLKTDVDNLHEVDVARAEANYKIEKEKCDALTGTAKDNCQKDAKTIYDAAIGQAKADEKTAKAAIGNSDPR